MTFPLRHFDFPNSYVNVHQTTLNDHQTTLNHHKTTLNHHKTTLSRHFPMAFPWFSPARPGLVADDVDVEGRNLTFIVTWPEMEGTKLVDVVAIYM